MKIFVQLVAVGILIVGCMSQGVSQGVPYDLNEHIELVDDYIEALNMPFSYSRRNYSSFEIVEFKLRAYHAQVKKHSGLAQEIEKFNKQTARTVERITSVEAKIDYVSGYSKAYNSLLTWLLEDVEKLKLELIEIGYPASEQVCGYLAVEMGEIGSQLVKISALRSIEENADEFYKTMLITKRLLSKLKNGDDDLGIEKIPVDTGAYGTLARLSEVFNELTSDWKVVWKYSMDISELESDIDLISDKAEQLKSKLMSVSSL